MDAAGLDVQQLAPAFRWRSEVMTGSSNVPFESHFSLQEEGILVFV